MTAHNIIAKAKPQLMRRRTHVLHPQNVVIVVSPHQIQAVNLQNLKRHSPQTQLVQDERKKLPTAVSKQQLLKQRRQSLKKPTVKYISAEPQPGSAQKISALYNVGRNRILIIVGNGPSITEMDLGQLAGHTKIDILSVNKPDSRVWPTKYWAFFDRSQFIRHEDIWNGYDGTMFNSTAIKRQKSTSIQFKNLGGKGWSKDLTKGIHIGRSSVFASMQIGMWMKYEHIYIVGCDMAPEGLNGKLHFYGQNPDVDPQVRKERFAKEAECYDYAAEYLAKEERTKFTFCSSFNKWAFVDKFNKIDHKGAVQHILDHAARI